MSVIRCLPIFILSTHSLKWETRKPSKAPSHKPKRFHIDVAFLTSELIKRYTRPFVGSIWEQVAKGFQMSPINGQVCSMFEIGINAKNMIHISRSFATKYFTHEISCSKSGSVQKIRMKYTSRSFATQFFTHEISYLKSLGVIDIPYTTSVPLPKIRLSDNSDVLTYMRNITSGFPYPRSSQHN